jgi:hypothetical protein
MGSGFSGGFCSPPVIKGGSRAAARHGGGDGRRVRQRSSGGGRRLGSAWVEAPWQRLEAVAEGREGGWRGWVAWGWVADAGGRRVEERGRRTWVVGNRGREWSEKKMIFQISTTHLRSDGPKIRTRRAPFHPCNLVYFHISLKRNKCMLKECRYTHHHLDFAFHK